MTTTTTTRSYDVTLADGSKVTIDNVAKVEKDGSGLRLYGADGTIEASFVDGQSKACWPSSAAVTAPATSTTNTTDSSTGTSS